MKWSIFFKVFSQQWVYAKNIEVKQIKWFFTGVFFPEYLNTENLQLKITFEVVLDTSKFGIVWDE